MMEYIWTLAFASLIILILQYFYKYLNKPFKYWEERGVPSVPAIPVFGSIYKNFTEVYHEFQVKRYMKYGRVHGIYESDRPVICVGDPDLLKDILVKDFHKFVNRRDFASNDPVISSIISTLRSEEWKRVRTIITPAFSSGKIKKMVSIFSDAAEITVKNFEKCSENGTTADCKKIFGAFTMDVIARAAFGTKVDSHNDPDNEFVKHARGGLGRGISFTLILFFLSPKLLKLLRRNIFADDVMAFFKDVTLRIIKERRETGQIQNDFLQLMMDASDEAEKELSSNVDETLDDENEKAIDDLCHEEENKQMFKRTKKYKGMSHNELIAQCVIFFLAGYETTASALSFISYLLAINPEQQEKLIKEIDETLSRNNNEMTYEAVQSMKYLENVIWETLRIFPPASVFERKAEEDYELRSTGITIPKGMIVNVPVYAIHHDPEFYEDPEKFDPNRFNPEEKARRNPYSYLPFGAGPRNCIGMRFALMEIKFCLTKLLSRFRLKRCSETKVPLEFKKVGPALLQPFGINLKIERRNDCVGVA